MLERKEIKERRGGLGGDGDFFVLPSVPSSGEAPDSTEIIGNGRSVGRSVVYREKRRAGTAMPL